MESFKDATGVERSLSLTIGKARRAAKTLKIDFIDGDPTAIANDLLVRKTLQIDLIWHLLDEKDAIEPDEGLNAQETFEETHLDGEAFDGAKLAMLAAIENFIRALRPEYLEVFKEAILLIRTQITESAKRAASLFQSTEVREGFLQANADAEKKAKREISKQFSKLLEDSESTPTPTP